MRLVDLSSPVDSTFWEPDPVTHTILSAAEGAIHMTAGMKANFGVALDPAELPGGEFLTNDILTLTAHTGTHVDAPAHYGTPSYGGPPRTIDQMPLDWFHRPAFVLNLRDPDTGNAGTGVVDAARLEKELARIGYVPQPLDIALLDTGASAWVGTQRYFTDFTGLDGSATRFLLDLGIRVIGTDAFSLDAPFADIIERYRRTGDPAVLWPAHVAGRDTEYCQIERLANLAALPPYGFTVSCFPVKIARAGAGWTRAVAHLPG
ncbi:MAG TPA: cyclase family protein [Mycobacteriales bacterium]|nr:cyclase family protein [Mycobacteriales bacterium]